MLRFHTIKNLSLKKKLFFSIFMGIFLFLIFMNIKENIRHHQLASSMDTLHTELKAANLPAKKTSGCGSGQGVYGPTGRSCSISLVVVKQARNTDEADLYLLKFKELIEGSEKYKANRALPSSVADDRSGLMFGGGYYYYKKTGTGCGASFDYKSKELNMRLSFTCDDSSWFTRTFQFN